ncbi:hypothetical protein Patl1_33113 [Pistacia atlantica]|uniref:Uncharacterized protein n=1 Tax=Pistacia atlantica TaxID=434234 RepID=A0ACC1ALX1_9ROSI|nr:hypothetical protein Patl1_33113 [Pistacia atlantica]
MKNQNDTVTLQWKVLGFGHENAVFVPSLNPYLGDDPAQCVAFGGVHSVALTSLGKIFAWRWKIGPWSLVEALMREVDLVIPSKVKALPRTSMVCLWWLVYNSADRGRATLELGRCSAQQVLTMSLEEVIRLVVGDPSQFLALKILRPRPGPTPNLPSPSYRPKCKVPL